MKLPSGGKLGLGMKCMGSFILPFVKDEAGPQALIGKELHAKLEKFVEGKRIVPSDATDADRELYSRFAKSIPAMDDERVECGLAYNAITGECGPYTRGDASDEAGRDRSFVCIADLIQSSSGGSSDLWQVAVWDYKSSGYVGDPEWNWQLILPGLWLWSASGCDRNFSCSLGIVYIGEPSGDGFRTESQVFGADFFERKSKELAALQRRAERTTPETVGLYEGKHCQYCPARHRCPAKVGAFANAIELVGGGVACQDRDLIKASRTLVDSKPQLDKMEKEILKRHSGELDLGDGRVAVLDIKEDKNGKIREKVYTKRAKEQARPNASEDGEPGASG